MAKNCGGERSTRDAAICEAGSPDFADGYHTMPSLPLSQGQRSRLFEQRSRSRHDRQRGLSLHGPHSVGVAVPKLGIFAADDHQRRGANRAERRTRHVGRSAA